MEYVILGISVFVASYLAGYWLPRLLVWLFGEGEK